MPIVLRNSRPSILVLAWLAACGDGRDGEGVTGSGTGAGEGSGSSSAGSESGDSASDDSGEASGEASSSGSGDSGSGSTTTTTGGSSGSDEGGDEGSVRLDVGPGMETGGGSEAGSCDPANEECGCTAVDLLFVIDNSTSMGSYQASLAAAAPGFADAIFASLPAGTDLHVGVTTSSFFGGSGGTSPGEGDCKPYYAGAGLTNRDDLYQWYWTPDAMPYGENGAQGRLRTHEGKTFFEVSTDDDPTAMKDWLVGNISSTGESGSVWEMVAAGAAYPFHPANAAANAGFLRDEGAVLVIFALTDEVDNSPEDVSAYHDMIVNAKQACGGDRCVVTAGVMQPCLVTETPENRIYPLLASFGKTPIIADIGPELDDCFEDCDDGKITQCNVVNPPVTCDELRAGGGAPQYADALGDALAQVVAQTCSEIPPPVG